LENELINKSKIEIKCPTLSLNGSIFLSTEIDEISTPNCLTNYYVFQNSTPYLPIQNEKAEAICLLNDDNITASWNIIQPCEPSCLIRDGGCDNNQICAKATGEPVLRCICAGYIGKYCEIIDPQGFFFHYPQFIYNKFHKKKKKRM